MLKRQTPIIFAAALVATLPLILHGTSCGHDLTFHLLNWMDAAHQWRHGTLRPWWCAAAAWNTGEARFLYYPPLSWMLGALYTLLVGAAHAPVLYTGLALAASGLTMRRFLADYVAAPIATLGACLYLAHPYMLFTATERTAYAELLAAAWLPLLLREALRPSASQATPEARRNTPQTLLHHLPLLGHGFLQTATRLAIPIALLILTNLPAAVLGTYALAIILAIRCILLKRDNQPVVKPLLLPAAAAYLFALALSAWYLLPALAQRGDIEVAQAFTSGMRPEEGTLFAHTGQAMHDAVVAQASWLAVVLLVCAALAAAVLLTAKRTSHRMHGMRQAELEQRHASRRDAITPVLLALSGVVLLLLTPASLIIWHHAPELHFLQFPFRTLMLQGVLTVTLVTLAVRSNLRMRTSALLSLTAVALLAFSAHYHYAQFCDDEDAPASLLRQYNAGGGFEPYDEYTPRDADNDLLHAALPPAWLAAAPDAEAPGHADTSTQAQRIVIVEGASTNLRTYVVRTAPADRFLIVRQRLFRNWHAAMDGQPIEPTDTRDDGLTALPLPATAGEHTLQLTYRWSPDQIAGAVLSAAALLLLVLLLTTSHRTKLDPSPLTR